MKRDQGRKETDRLLKELEAKIRKEYEQAEKDLKKKLDKHMSAFKEKDARKRDQLQRGVITAEEYRQWRMGQLAVGRRWEEMRDTIAKDLANHTEIAKSMANGYMPQVYAVNANYAAYEIEHGLRVDTSFTLYNQQSVERLIRDNPEILPPPGKQMIKKIREGKAIRWEKGQIQSVITQAILQGESIPHIADRMAKTLCTKDREAAFRYARTATTEAENAGRMESYRRAQSMGIKLKKMWLAVLDDRTRDAHRELDGQSIPLDDYFENSIGKILKPGDHTAKPANVWNCRCGMISQLEGFERDPADLGLRRNNKLGSMSYEEWKRGHGKPQGILKPDEVADIMKGRYASDYRR